MTFRLHKICSNPFLKISSACAQERCDESNQLSNTAVNCFHPHLILCVYRELVEELHPLMKEALERRPEVTDSERNRTEFD